MNSCTKGDAAKEMFCACVIDKLSNTVSTRDFARIAHTRKPIPRVTRAAKRATTACGGTA
jgi:nicotinate-nucleotide pyrophosphorylase